MWPSLHYTHYRRITRRTKNVCPSSSTWIIRPLVYKTTNCLIAYHMRNETDYLLKVINATRAAPLWYYFHFHQIISWYFSLIFLQLMVFSIQMSWKVNQCIYSLAIKIVFITLVTDNFFAMKINGMFLCFVFYLVVFSCYLYLIQNSWNAANVILNSISVSVSNIISL